MATGSTSRRAWRAWPSPAASASHNVFNQVKGKVDTTFEDLGAQQVKNIPEPVSTYRVRLDIAQPRESAEPPKAVLAGILAERAPPRKDAAAMPAGRRTGCASV